MITNLETTATPWDDARDGAFFRIVANLFPADVVLAASVLLASYDSNDAQIDQNAPLATV